MKKLRTGVIGTGMIGSLHARAYAEHDLSELTAVADVDPERAQAMGELYGVPWFGSAEELLDGAEVDAVTIAVSEHHRRDPALACARRGVHLLLEKPLAPDLAGAERLCGELRPLGVKIMVNFILRFDPRFMAVKEAAASGRLGTLHYMSARRRGTGLGAEIYGPWTDLLISTGIHDLEAMAWIADAPAERVYAEGVSRRSAEWGHQDAVAVLMRFSGDVIAALETSWVLPTGAPAPLDASLHVIGDGGAAVIEGSNSGLSILDEGGYAHPDLVHWPVDQRGLGGDLAAAVDHFIRSVLTDQDPQVGLDQGLYAHRLVDAADRSLRENRPIHLE